MNFKSQRPWWRIRLWKVAVAAIILLTIYCGSFFAVRRGGSVTFIVREPPHFYSVAVFCFSKNRQLNYAAWLFYYPLHRQSSDSLQRLEQALFVADADEEMSRRQLRYFYIADVDVLREAGLAGFRK
jgi:hypothetical protein